MEYWNLGVILSQKKWWKTHDIFFCHLGGNPMYCSDRAYLYHVHVLHMPVIWPQFKETCKLVAWCNFRWRVEHSVFRLIWYTSVKRHQILLLILASLLEVLPQISTDRPSWCVNPQIALLFLRMFVALGGKTLPEKRDVLFSNCKPVRIDHGEFKDSDFNDDRQPEIALWPPKPEVLLSPKIW